MCVRADEASVTKVRPHDLHLFAGYKRLSDAQPALCVSRDEDGMTFESTELGRVMAKYCVAFKVLFC